MVELSVTTEDVLICCDGKMDPTGHIPLSTFQRNLIFFNLTQEVFWRGFWRPGIQTPKSTFAVRHPNPPFVSWKSGVKDGEALKERGFKPLHLYCKITLLILIFFLIREQEEGGNNNTNLLNKIQNHNRLVNSTLLTRILTSKKWDSNSRL